MSNVSVVLLADHGSWGLSRMEGSEAQNTKRALRVRDRHSQVRVKDFGEMSSVSIVVLSEQWWGRLVARKKKKKNSGQIWNFCFCATPVYSSEGKDIDRFCWLQQEERDLSMTSCVQTVCLCVSREVLWRKSQFRDVFLSQTWRANVLRKPRWCARLAVSFYELRLI